MNDDSNIGHEMNIFNSNTYLLTSLTANTVLPNLHEDLYPFYKVENVLVVDLLY